MELKPWRDIAIPHEDVLSGNFKQAEFAADLSLVHDTPAKAPAEYRDPVKFFARTFITEGMGLLLDNVIRRLSGGDGDPVIQLQTAFGGGKTHTLLAVYHLARRAVPPAEMAGISTLLDKAGVTELPAARLVVLDGNRLAPGQARSAGVSPASGTSGSGRDAPEIHTLWGELAWQLGGDAAYAQVADSDRHGTSPGKGVLTALLEHYAPCVILMDETVAYLRQFEDGKSYSGGTFDSNLSFIQALTEAVSAVPKAVLLASLPESRCEAGGVQGEKALATLEHYFQRVQAIWKPVAAEEAFEIVRRRLFSGIRDDSAKEQVCRAFADFYRQHHGDFPLATQESGYFRRLMNAYPIHPEVFDRLYEDWSSLDNFQRTRGVLKLMAQVIFRLWQDANKDPLILPGSLPLYDTPVRNALLAYLPQGWEPVMDKEIDGTHAASSDIDRDSRFGAVQAARRCARSIFLGTAPNVEQQRVRGIEVERVVLGCAQPGQSSGVFKDVLRRMNDRFSYLYFDNNRFWFDTRPNLRREMEERKQRFDEQEVVLPELRARVTGVFAKGPFAGVHVFATAADIPDDWGLRLVVLPPSAAWHKRESARCFKQALEILTKRGEQPRIKQNRLIFLAPEADSVSRLKEQARIFLAWRSIVQDAEDLRLTLDGFQQRQAEQNRDAAQKSVEQLVREAYCRLVAPIQEERPGGLSDIQWEVFPLISSAPNLMDEIKRVMNENALLIEAWAPMFLAEMLRKWFWKPEQPAADALEVWQKTCCYVYLPRLLHDGVFKESLHSGLQSRDYFGYAHAAEDDRYPGFVFGGHTRPLLDGKDRIIEKTAAEAYQAELDAAQPREHQGGNAEADKKSPLPTQAKNRVGEASGPLTSTPVKRRFYGSVSLDPIKARMEFGTILDEVIQQFLEHQQVKINLILEIAAESETGFDENLQRTIRENCSVLQIKPADFEE